MERNPPRRVRSVATRLAAGFLAAGLLLQIAPGRAASAPAAGWGREDAAHLLRRAGFGGTPEQIDRLQALGRDGAVDYLLAGRLPAGAKPVFEPVALEAFKSTPIEIDPELARKAREERMAKQADKAATADGKPGEAKPAEAPGEAAKQVQRMVQQANQRDVQRLRTWWVDRMVRTDRPLEEKMTLFWHGLFTSGVKEVKSGPFMVGQNALFHKEALGNYKQLTHAIVHDAAMLKYLNNDQNVAGKPNENLARELMELFTMGEGKGYTETDIKEVARALTGLSPAGGPRAGLVANPPPARGPAARGARRGGPGALQNGTPVAEGDVILRPRLHDTGTKTIFGKTGPFGPDDVIELIFARPEPARHLARKLWEFYAYPNPSPTDLDPVVRALERNQFDVKSALRVLFTSPAFYSEPAKFALIKSPAELAVETVRTLGGSSDETTATALVGRMRAMDQELLQPPNVRGWVGGDNWVTASTLYARYNAASAIVNGTLNLGGRGGMGMRPNAGKGPGGPGGPAANMREAREQAVAAQGGGPNAVSVVKLFPALARDATAGEVVDAATARFIQRPLHPEKRQALVEALGDAPLTLGQPQSDARVRQMLCLMLSTPEYQVH